MYSEVWYKQSIFKTENLTWIPEWVPAEKIPYYKMPVDDAVWYPPMLEGKSLGGRFAFNGVTLTGSVLWEMNQEEKETVNEL